MKNKIIFLIILTFIFSPLYVDAKTLGDLKRELASYQAKYNAAQEKKKNTQNQINSDKSNIINKQNEIQTGKQQVIDATNESAKLSEDIESKKDSLENLMNAYQVSSGDNVYLEYVFEATSYEDLVYRYAVSEEVMDYVNDQIDEYKNKIKKNDELKAYIADREVELNNQINNLNNEIDSLGDDLAQYDKEADSFSEQVSSTKSTIKSYEDMGCKDNDDLDVCASIYGDTRFIKPLKKGVVTSYFSNRISPITGRPEYHSGTDIGGNSEGTSVYSIANGVVGKIVRYSSCGGNKVYIYHTINGRKYTSFYYHLLTINVSVGQRVTNQSVIGTVGGGRSTRSYDYCSTGAHLHLGLANGWYGRDYVSWNKFVSSYIDARPVVGIPKMGVWFYSRY